MTSTLVFTVSLTDGQMAIRNYHWDPVNDCVLWETDESGNTIVTYTHEPGPFGPFLTENRNGTEYYHHYDALGSTTMLADDTGTVTDTFEYDAWGNIVERTGTTPTPYQWVGRWGYQYDMPTGNYYIRARSYQPTVARWSSPDPAHAMKIYVYSRMSPWNYFDPTGLAELSVLESIKRNNWVLQLNQISLLKDGAVSYEMQWDATIFKKQLPPPVEQQAQMWMLNLISEGGLIFQNGKCSTYINEETVVDIRPISPRGGVASFTDISSVKVSGQWCVFYRSVAKLAGINGDSYESRLPVQSNWKNPPQGVVSLMLSDMRARFMLIIGYSYVNHDVCKRCQLDCDKGVNECVTSAFGEVCNRDVPPF